MSIARTCMRGGFYLVEDVRKIANARDIRRFDFASIK